MKRFTTLLILFIVVTNCIACRRSTGQLNSNFYASFSIAEIVEENNQYLLPGSRVTSGMETGSRELFLQKHEEMILPMDPSNYSAFMEVIQSAIEKEITRSGALVQGRGMSQSDTVFDYFSFDYRQDETSGVIHVWGVPGGERNLNIVALITER